MQPLDKPLEPTRTLLIVGFENTEAYEHYRDSSIPHDKIVEHYTIPKSNFLFVIFYDVRDAIEFVKNFPDGPLRVQHTISKYEIPRKIDECSEKSLQCSINFLFRGLEVNIEDGFMANFLKQYGDIREVRNSKPQQKTVEFFDIRGAVKAFETLNESTFGAGIVKCRWVWDLPLNQRAEYLRLTDVLLKQFANLPGENVAPVSKRARVGEPASSSNKNVFIALFDRFIGENIGDVEKAFKF